MLHLADGTTQSEHVRHGRGTPGRPMSDAELDAKVRELVAYGAPFVDADRPDRRGARHRGRGGCQPDRRDDRPNLRS